MCNEYNNKVMTSSYCQEGHIYDMYDHVTVYSTVEFEGHTQKQINSRSLVDHGIADLRRQFNF